MRQSGCALISTIKIKSTRKLNFDENFLSSLHDHEKPYQDEIKRELFNKVIEITHAHPDSRVGTIFEMRYVVGNKKQSNAMEENRRTT